MSDETQQQSQLGQLISLADFRRPAAATEAQPQQQPEAPQVHVHLTGDVGLIANGEPLAGRLRFPGDASADEAIAVLARIVRNYLAAEAEEQR